MSYHERVACRKVDLYTDRKVLYYVQEDCCLSLWNPTNLFGKLLSLTSYSGFPNQICTKLLHESLHIAFQFTSYAPICNYRTNCMPHPDIWNLEALSCISTLFHLCHLYGILKLKAEMRHCGLHACLDPPPHLLTYFWFHQFAKGPIFSFAIWKLVSPIV